jgi:hypothetical protein
MTSSSDPVANWAKLFAGANKCNSFDPQTAIDGLSLVIPNANRAWFWQTCNEFGWLKPSYPGTSIFWGDVTLENLLAGCQAAFGMFVLQSCQSVCITLLTCSLSVSLSLSVCVVKEFQT